MATAAASAPALKLAAVPGAKLTTAREAAARKAADAASRAKATATAQTAAPVVRPSTEERAPTPAVVVAEQPKPVVEAPASAAAPSEPCCKGLLLGKLACMKATCANAEWVRHPQCVEWRRMEERRNYRDQQN